MPDTWTPPYPELKFDADLSSDANEEWGANCGAHSIAAVCGLPLEVIRPHIPNFRGWMNPTQVSGTLASLGRAFTLTKGLKTQELCTGINRVQWEGPWLEPGRPPAAAYRHTHYVAHFADPAGSGWVLCTAICPWAWVHRTEWKKQTLGRGDLWHITHHWKLA